MFYTDFVPGRFNRFADRVLGPGATTEQKDDLRKQLDKLVKVGKELGYTMSTDRFRLFFATLSAGQPTKESTTKRSPFDAEMALREVPRSMPTWRMSAIFKSLSSSIR